MIDKFDDLLINLFNVWLRLVMVFVILATLILFGILLYWGIGMLATLFGFGIGC